MEQLLGLEPGELSRHLGYLPIGAPPPVPLAIEADPGLSEDARRILLGTYRAAKQAGRD